MDSTSSLIERTHAPRSALAATDFMNPTSKMFFSRFASDLMAAFICLLFAAWNMIGQSFHRAPSMSIVGERWPGAEFVFGGCALMSVAGLGYGMLEDHRYARVAGFVIGFAVFAACFVSTIHTLPCDPAAPVFLGMALGYLWRAGLITLRIC